MIERGTAIFTALARGRAAWRAAAAAVLLAALVSCGADSALERAQREFDGEDIGKRSPSSGSI